jgi:hypothetical protein
MCFSAAASFGAGAILTTTGIISLRINKQKERTMFSAIPLLFGLQQFSEGFVWLALTGHPAGFGAEPPGLIFLLFAQVLWPLWVPWSVLRMEQNSDYRTLLRFLTGLGCAVSAFLLIGLLFFFEPVALISGHHIRYDFQSYVHTSQYTGFLYVLPTVLPPFLAASKRCHVLGWANLASFFITKFFFTEHIISVWCYFAAIMSAAVVWIVSQPHTEGSGTSLS